MRVPSIGLIFLFRRTSSSTARSVVVITRPCAGWLWICSLPNRPIVSTMSMSNGCGTGKREYLVRASTTCSASCPAARAFHSASGVTR
jgi:hypothetical protein